MVKVENGVAVREPLPAFLLGLEPDSLSDLSWTDAALGVTGMVWWPEVDESGELGRDKKWGAETLSVDSERKVVIVKRKQVAMTAAEKSERDAVVQAQVTALFEQAVQTKLDAAARDRGYDSLATAISYAEEPAVPRFQADGQAFRRWRSLVWDYAHSMLNAVLAGEQAQPELEGFLEALPALELPA